MSYTLYGAPDSANIVVQMILEQLGVVFEMQWVDRSAREHLGENYRNNLNPQGLIPVLVDAQTPIFETAAIALHLSDKHRLLAPQQPGSSTRSRFLQWLFYLSNTLHADLRVQFYSERHVSAVSAVAPLLERTKERVAGHFKLIEAELGNTVSGPWFLGSELSVLDFYLGALCRWSVLYPTANALQLGRPEYLPNLHRLLGALEALPAVQRALAPQKIKPPYFINPTPPALPPEQVCAG